MIAPVIGQMYQEPRTGLVVIAVTRLPEETDQRRFPGRVLFAGRSSSWTTAGQRLANLRVSAFEPLGEKAEDAPRYQFFGPRFLQLENGPRHSTAQQKNQKFGGTR